MNFRSILNFNPRDIRNNTQSFQTQILTSKNPVPMLAIY